MTGSTFDDREMRHSGAILGHDLGGAPLVVRIEEREQEAHGEGLDAFRLQAMHGRARSPASSSGVTTSPR